MKEREYIEYRLKPKGSKWGSWNECHMRDDYRAHVLAIMGGCGALVMRLTNNRERVEYRRRWSNACLKHGCYGCCEMRLTGD